MSLYDELQKNNQSNYFYNSLTVITRKKRHMLSVLLELSPICNFSCPFCYARKTPEELKRDKETVLRFDYWKGIMDQLQPV